jgi:uncharacterized protein
MDVTPLIPQGRKIIQSYGPKGFKVSGVSYDTPLIITPLSCTPWNAPVSVDNLAVSDFSFFKDKKGEIDVVLLGAGTKPSMIADDIRTALRENGISIDVMETGAACRTYNVLMAEGRRVAAMLMPL